MVVSGVLGLWTTRGKAGKEVLMRSGLARVSAVEMSSLIAEEPLDASMEPKYLSDLHACPQARKATLADP